MVNKYPIRLLPEPLAFDLPAVSGVGRRVPAHKVNALSDVGPDSGIYAALQQAGIRIQDFPVSDKWIKYNHFYDISFCQFGIQNL